MRFIDIDLDGTVVRAQLNESKAPKTTAAVWDALPFEGRAVHAQLSGDMFRMLDRAPVPDGLPIESAQTFQHPGSVVFYPPLNEIAFGYGVCRFKGHTGWLDLTPLAEIEGDITAFGNKARALMETGARPIRFRRSADQATPFRYAERKGRKVTVELGGVKAQGTLLEDLAPNTVAALVKKLPITGVATNDNWGGLVTRVWPGEHGQELDLGITRGESERRLLWPGYAYYDTVTRSLRICHGDGYIGDDAFGRPVTPVFALDGDWEAYRAVAAGQLTEGRKPIRIALA